MKLNKVLIFSLIACLCAVKCYCAPIGGDGRKTVATGGSAEAISSSAVSVTSVTICAETDNTGIMAVGYSPVASLSTREGINLSAGVCTTLNFNKENPEKLSNIKLDTTVNGDGVTYFYTLS